MQTKPTELCPVCGSAYVYAKGTECWYHNCVGPHPDPDGSKLDAQIREMRKRIEQEAVQQTCKNCIVKKALVSIEKERDSLHARIAELQAKCDVIGDGKAQMADLRVENEQLREWVRELENEKTRLYAINDALLRCQNDDKPATCGECAWAFETAEGFTCRRQSWTFRDPIMLGSICEGTPACPAGVRR